MLCFQLTGEDVRVLTCSMGCTVSSCPLDSGRERVQAGEGILKDYCKPRHLLFQQEDTMTDNGDPLPLAKPSNNKSSSTKRMATIEGHLVLQRKQKKASRARRTGKPLLPSRPPPTSYLILCLRNCTPVVIVTSRCPGLFGKRTMGWGVGVGRPASSLPPC